MRRWTALDSGIRQNERFAALPDDTCRLFYVMLMAQLDSWGRAGANARLLVADVWPLLDKSDAETSRCLWACVAAKLVEVHEADGSTWVQFPDWDSGPGVRLDRRGASSWPTPSAESSRSSPGVVAESSTSRASARCPVLLDPVGSEESAERGRIPTVAALVAEFPILDTLPFRETWETWVSYRREIKHPYKSAIGVRKAAKELASWGPGRAIVAIEHTMAKGWQGIQEPHHAPGTTQNGFKSFDAQLEDHNRAVAAKFLKENP